MGARVFVSCFLVFGVLAGAAIRGQTTYQSPPGSVSGHVSCADTNHPARLSRGTIEPADDLLPGGVDSKATIAKQRSVPAATATQPGADGSYPLEGVPPGPYYIVAQR